MEGFGQMVLQLWRSFTTDEGRRCKIQADLVEWLAARAELQMKFKQGRECKGLWLSCLVAIWSEAASSNWTGSAGD
ncbi:hypothetical protein KFK09_017830 [Dendrobium nobile]|uniref:Uncharacterized protein n=1 Tax=Dendrobium nobile TaxID=94219 RepID=A0A8T3AU85_DENNO|nr:hypothetical protein KFK09_017830 [Dendrobium nobile]